MPPLAVFNHLSRIEQPKPKKFICAACPPRTWQAKDQKVESNKLKKGEAGGSRTETAGLGESGRSGGGGCGQAWDTGKRRLILQVVLPAVRR